jgi:hypothetical protein
MYAWLGRVDELPPDDARERLREGLIRSLSTRDARPVAGALMVRQFRTVSRDPVRWAAGNAIGIVADSTVFAEVADLVREPSNGIARQMPVEALPRIGGRANRGIAIEILIDLLSDDDVVLHAIFRCPQDSGRPSPPGAGVSPEPRARHHPSSRPADARPSAMTADRPRALCSAAPDTEPTQPTQTVTGPPGQGAMTAA